MNLTSDNLTNIIVAVIATFGVIWSSRLAKRKNGGHDQSEADRLRMRLLECEEARDKERALFFEERSRWLERHLDAGE